MTNPVYAHLLKETSQSLNMTQHYFKTDMKRLAEYWEVVLENGHINDVNTAILFLDTVIHGYLKAKGIDIGNRKMLKRDQAILAGMMLMIPMYVLDQPENIFPKIHQLTPIAEEEVLQGSLVSDILVQAENILREKNQDKR
jgi:hypothetical protein